MPASTPGVGSKGFYKFEEMNLADRAQLRVNLANGNLLLRQKELVIRGTNNHDLSLERVYNSQRTMNRELGNGWTLGPGQQSGLYHDDGQAGRDLAYEDENGTRWYFTYDTIDGDWNAPAGMNATLTRNATNGDYIIKDRKSRKQLIFNAAGLLQVIKDKHGNRIDPQYDGTEYVKRIVDTQLRRTDIQFTGTRITGISDPAARTTSYRYTGDELTTATDMTGQVWNYEYVPGGDLSRIVDPRGNETRITYDTSGRVTGVTRVTDRVNGAGPTWSFAYHAAGACPNPNNTTACTEVSNANGNNTTHGHNPRGSVN